MHEKLYRDIYETELTHWWPRGRRHILSTMLRRFTPRDCHLRIADVGCGMGSTFAMLYEFGAVVGIDSSPTALSFSKKRGHPALAAAALPDLPFANETFDIVCALDVIEHTDDDFAAVAELWRICRPGGLLLITVPAYQWLWSEHDEINEHRRRYTRPRLRESFQALPIEYLKLSYMNALLAPPVMVVRLLKKLFRKAPRNPDQLKSDIFSLPPMLNGMFETLFASEAIWLRHGSLPLGISVLCVARVHKQGPSTG